MLHVVGVSNNFFKLLGPQNCIRMPQNHCREAQSLDALLVMSTGPTPTITSIPKRGTYQCVNKVLPIWTYLWQAAIHGSVDILKESWEKSSQSDESIVLYVLTIWEKLENISSLVQQNTWQRHNSSKVLVWLERLEMRVHTWWSGTCPILPM